MELAVDEHDGDLLPPQRVEGGSSSIDSSTMSMSSPTASGSWATTVSTISSAVGTDGTPACR
ncbi:hypothetical protein [Microbacterium sp. NIBRBAC000506063]|uniref:hypothetical protein n=1 Tax=Microbacterium sp. NIBRBAC000506063 TaxID=2734618 RepID=UPI001BB77B3D|nr:hypothetical protein [Microbacterium sp. NIBRBAC000506063]QTV80111.1 hypothetical protein KAE78_03240 [Microbacterium sp. NIBRBAC000506063]